MTTGGEWLAKALPRLSHLASPEVDAEILLEHVTGVDRHLLRQHLLLEVEITRLEHLLVRRIAGEPVQYISGQAPFRHLVLHIGPGALVPRPETELLVDHALVEIAAGAQRIADLGSGAGPIAIAIATESLTPVEVFAVEREVPALVWLRRNVNDFAPKVSVIEADVRDLTRAHCGGLACDLVVANPPYLPDDSELPSEVAEHEPAAALWGGGDGTEVPSRFAFTAWRILRPGGLLLMEHSDRHQDVLVERLGESGWQELVGHRDLTGRPRFIAARKPESASGAESP